MALHESLEKNQVFDGGKILDDKLKLLEARIFDFTSEHLSPSLYFIVL